MARRQLCRALFLLLCVTPTVGVTAWAVGRRLPGAEQRWADDLSRRLGVGVACERVATPRPGVIRLKGVVFTHAEVGDRIATCDRVEARWSAGELSLHAAEVSIPVGAADEAGAVLLRVLRDDRLPAARAQIERLVIGVAPGGARRWRGVAARLSAADPDRGRRLHATAGGASLTAARNRQITPPATRVDVTTGGEGLPASLLPGFCRPVGPGVELFGRFGVTTTGSGGAGALSGRLTGLDPGALLNLGRPTATIRCTGGVTADVKSLSWRRGRIDRLHATLTGGAGAVDRSLILAADRSLGCRAGQPLLDEWGPLDGPAVRFDALHLIVRLDADGLGLSTPGDRGLLSRAGCGLLYPPAARRLAVDALLHFAAPPGAPLRPTGSRVETLAERLPRPRSRAAADHHPHR